MRRIQHGWEIYKEFTEKGVSGFKVSIKNRDAMRAIQHDAILGLFDVLLVFMFDRLGRRDDETPFVVEWFVQNGIQVWSAQEGEQRFDTHVDKLMNYIRYWQASGESVKTAIRTKTRLDQMTQAGIFRGGSAPYGYRLEKQGRMNKKNQEVNEIVVDKETAEIVQKIFELYTRSGYGSQRICTYLTQHGIHARNGREFVNCTIQNILRNEAYLGILKNGEVRSQIIPHLQIIDPTTFALAQQLTGERSKKHNIEQSLPLNTTATLTLLSGNLFCGHCGGRLVVSSCNKKYLRKDGITTTTSRARYVCYNKTRHPKDCNGQTGYTAKKLDAGILDVVRQLFSQIQEPSARALLLQQKEKDEKACKRHWLQAQTDLKSLTNDLSDLAAEALRATRGASRFNPELLNSAYKTTQQKMAAQSDLVQQLQREYEDMRQRNKTLSQSEDYVMTWAELFKQCTMEEQKMVLGHLFRRIDVDRDYQVNLTLSISYQQFMSFMRTNSTEAAIVRAR